MSHDDEVRAWQRARTARLGAPDGWLALVGRFWLHEGENRIGSDPDSDVVLPQRFPRFAGTAHLGAGAVVVEAPPEASLRLDGAPIGRAELRLDATATPALTLGSVRLELLRRGARVAMRLRDPESPERRAFSGLDYYPIRPEWRIEARFVPYDPPTQIDVEFEVGEPSAYRCPGAAVFHIDGKEQRLEPVIEHDRERLFVLFADPTNRDETYGAGRFLYADMPAGDRVVLDFNKAFNPPCAVTPWAVCPLVPAANRLTVRVEAGEKRP